MLEIRNTLKDLSNGFRDLSNAIVTGFNAMRTSPASHQHDGSEYAGLGSSSQREAPRIRQPKLKGLPKHRSEDVLSLEVDPHSSRYPVLSADNVLL